MSHILDRDVYFNFELELHEIVSAFCGEKGYDEEDENYSYYLPTNAGRGRL